MARYGITVESVTALGAGTTFANLVPGASNNLKLRRVKLGCRAGTGAPTSQQITVGIFRATARGTASTTTTGLALDPRSAASVSTGVDSAWSVNPTLAANPFDKISINDQSAADVPYELLEEVICDQGTANGIAFQNIGNALPTGHLLTLSLEWEE